MPLEIERKFIVKDSFKDLSFRSFRVVQGYLSTDPGRTVRVRIRDDRAFLTVKGATGGSGMTRFEWETEIPVKDAEELLGLCLPGVIDKTRYLVRNEGHVFEVDEFHGDNEGLVVAEVELESEGESFEMPGWLGKEVTGDDRYYNSALASNPYKNWK